MPHKRLSVHVVGTGTIGEPLIGLLLGNRDRLCLEQVTFSKRTPGPKDTVKVNQLISRGAKFAAVPDKIDEFKKCGQPVAMELEQALEEATVVIDCTSKGGGLKNKEESYSRFENNTKGFIAQGSEFGFGKMYARGINDQSLIPGEDRYVHVVSCNTHNLAVLIKTIGFHPDGESNLDEGRFVCLRRANDISQSSSYIPAPEAGTHKDERFGTHHARDAWHLFQTLDVDLNLYSSAVKLNTQYMHTIWFNLKLREPLSQEEVIRRMRDNPRIAVTDKMMSNQVFSFGRDHGYFGRIFNQTVVCLPTVAIKDNEVVGFCFTPQDGNSILSTVAVMEWFVAPETYEERLSTMREYFFEEV